MATGKTRQHATGEVGEIDLEDRAAFDAALAGGAQIAVSVADMPEWMVREFEEDSEERGRKAGGDAVGVDRKGS